jgi:hypothetical protein
MPLVKLRIRHTAENLSCKGSAAHKVP